MGSLERTDLSMLGIKFLCQVVEEAVHQIQSIAGLRCKTSRGTRHCLEEVETQPPSAAMLEEADMRMEWVSLEAYPTRTKAAVPLSKDPLELGLEAEVLVQPQAVAVEPTIRVVPREQVRILNSKIIR
jgi:hypothetical protein